MVWYEAKNNKKPYCLSIDEIENYIKYNCLVNNHNDIIKDIHKFIRDGQYDIMKDLYYYITIYNTLENNINSCFFKDVLINLSTNKGIHIMESTRLNEDNKKFDNMIKEQKKELRNKLYDELIKYDPITQQEYDEINKKMNHEQKLTDDEKNKHKLKTLLNRFKYPNEKYNNLDNNNKLSLIKFMDDDMNHEIFINKSNVLIRDTVEESIKYINEQDKQRLNTAPNDHNYKQYHRMHLLIDKLIKILGFNNIEDYETKINNDDLKKKLDDNKIDLLNIINEINYINKNKLKDKITNIKTINTIINNFYGHKLERIRNTTKDKKMTVSFKISNSIKWGESYLPTILKIDKINHNEYLF